MNTVIKGTKTIAEYKRVREDMENLARANYARHKEAFEEREKRPSAMAGTMPVFSPRGRVRVPWYRPR